LIAVGVAKSVEAHEVDDELLLPQAENTIGTELITASRKAEDALNPLFKDTHSASSCRQRPHFSL
jgi:hypothetical protein